MPLNSDQCAANSSWLFRSFGIFNFPKYFLSTHQLNPWMQNLRMRICGQLYLGSREGDGTPLQYSCLENPMDGGAW